MRRLALPSILIAAVVQPAIAEDLRHGGLRPNRAGQVWVNVGGVSQHFANADTMNQQNFGYGMEYQVDRKRYLVLGMYRNSVYDTTHYVGGAWMPLTLGFLKLGAIAGVANGYEDMRNGGFFPVILPVLALEGGRVGANFVYIPTIAAKVSGAVAMQVKYRFY